MVRRLIDWAVNNRLIVLLCAVTLAAYGAYAFFQVDVEAYPDPAPAIIEVIAPYPGASAEEVERQVTVPLEITLAGMPGLKFTRSKSLFGLSHLRNQFDYGIEFNNARQEVINRLQFTQALPAGVTPQISPQSPTGEIYRYTIGTPEVGRPEPYTLGDLKTLQDWTLGREFRRIPRIADVVSFGGVVKRYEVQPDPDRLRRYGISLSQLQSAIANSNANVGGDYLVQGCNVFNIRAVGLIGGARDPMNSAEVLGAPDAGGAAAHLRAGEDRRLRDIREVVIASANNVPVCVGDVVDGGPLRSVGEDAPAEGVVVGHQTRLGKVSLSRPRAGAGRRPLRDAAGRIVWDDEEEKVQGIILLRKGESSRPALADVEAKVSELNGTPGRLLPGTRIEPYYDRSNLIHVTSETVRENLVLGMAFVGVVLLTFLSNVRAALIVAINVPLALLFAFTALFVRGKSANLLSIGAVDFGIIVDGSVIIVENVYRHLASEAGPAGTLGDRVVRASGEVEKGILFSTAIMVCAFIPLFTMRGPEGQIFGPMAETYAFALAGALLLALTVSPVLCVWLFKSVRPGRENPLVRWLRGGYLRQLGRCLEHRGITLAVFASLLLVTAWAACFGIPGLWGPLGREFMPELEEGNLWVRASFPLNASVEEVSNRSRSARALIRAYPEVELVVNQIGRPDDGTDPTGFYNSEFFVPLKRPEDWPPVVTCEGWRRLFAATRSRTKDELRAEMNETLSREIPGVDWNFSQNIRDNVMESLSGIKGDNSVKIIGPDLGELERLADQVKVELAGVRGVENVGVFRVLGQPNLDLPVDREKCKAWGVSVADVENTVRSAVAGQAVTQVIEGEKTFDVTLRWPERLRGSEQAILDIPVDLTNNTVVAGVVPGLSPTPVTGVSAGVSPTGSSVTMPSLTGSAFSAPANLWAPPRRPLRNFLTPLNLAGRPDPDGGFVCPGASTVYREQGQRLIPVKFSVHGRDLAGAVAEAQSRIGPLVRPPYRVEWSGEFQEMEDAEKRLMLTVPASAGVIVALLYLAFRSTADVLAALSNVVALSVGGVWALLLTGTNFSISAAVGFISIFGVAVMDGLLSLSNFNRLRAQGRPLREAILEGAGMRVRPMFMTALTAVFGLLPAALSTRIGAQTQRPLAIVVVGGMLMTLAVNRYLMPVLYSCYGHRQPPGQVPDLAH
jgi:cobalt-zinc-cadmium resistance protein CzcA